MIERIPIYQDSGFYSVVSRKFVKYKRSHPEHSRARGLRLLDWQCVLPAVLERSS